MAISYLSLFNYAFQFHLQRLKIRVVSLNPLCIVKWALVQFLPFCLMT